jgi:hypothetical protein
LSGQAHNDALLVLCATAFVWTSRRERWIEALLSLWLGTATKYALAPVLGFHAVQLARTARKRLFLAAVLGGVFLVVVWTPFFEGVASLDGVFFTALPKERLVINSLASLATALGAFLGVPLFDAWVYFSLAAAVAVAVKQARSTQTAAGALRSSLSLLFLLQVLVVPRYWPWYATWLVPFALASALVAEDRERKAVAIYSALVPALYLTGPAGGAAIVVVQGVGLWAWFEAWRGALSRGAPSQECRE